MCHARPAFQLGWEKGAREIGHSLVVRAQSGRRLDVGHSRAIQRANDTKSGAVWSTKDLVGFLRVNEQNSNANETICRHNFVSDR